MLNLQLRQEFQGPHTPGTMISLRQDGQGATEISPDYILSITYPTADVRTALKNVSSSRAQKPLVLLGDRGRGKSHIMALIHHALTHPQKVEQWASAWQSFADFPELRDISIEPDYHPISEPLHNQEYPLLWELLFAKHPYGDHARGKFEQTGHPYPPRSLLEEMFQKQPTALILDEFQKWFESLSDQPGTEGKKYRTWAENFIQNLSELAQERPDILILVTSVLNSDSEAFRQIHRVGPVLIDFSGPTARKDRQKLVLHRLFENRAQLDESSIQNVVSSYASERFRLKFSHHSSSEKPACYQEVMDCFPFSPELHDLLDNQILMAEAAQEARDLIRILAFVYSARGESVPLVTPADFFVDDDSCGVQSLLDSIATAGEQERLREIAQRNLETVRETTDEELPHAREIISTLWMRSMTPARAPGATPPEIQLDITRNEAIDDNMFNNELARIIENSMNVHGEQTAEKRLHFGVKNHAQRAWH